MELLQIVFRTTFFYFSIVLAYRIMGKREIGQLGIIDLIVSILIAELVAISIENLDKSILYAIIPLIILVIIELILAKISLKSRKFRKAFDGKPSVIIQDGKINYKEMMHQRYTLDDLLLHLRQKEIRSIEEVEYALLETNGKLSIFKYNLVKTKSNYPLPLIIDGIIQDKTLKHLNKNKNWLLREIKDLNLKINNIFYAFYKGKKIYIIEHKDLIK